MRKSLTVIIVLAILGAAFGAWVLSKPRETNTITNSSQSSQFEANAVQNTNISPTAQPEVSYTLIQVSQHSKEDDCWTVINGKVYDLSSFIRNHPGGQNILSACGVDASSYWQGQQAGQLGEANDHSADESAMSELAQLRVGKLSD
ncbi:MAG: cytochrome b5 domain-containing protein [bacterium]|nr:cytochrome b5 domain-containing protein [bacterium]